MSYQAQIPLPFTLKSDSDRREDTVNLEDSTAVSSREAERPTRLLAHGQTFSSPGGHFTYRVLGPCCRLFDREEMPWPCCRLQWRSKEPSWRRVGRRFVPDIAAKRSPSYQVEILNPEYPTESVMMTMYWIKLSPEEQQWWYTKVRAAQPKPS